MFDENIKESVIKRGGQDLSIGTFSSSAQE